MKTNISVQSATWRTAFAEGLARGEAAFGEDNGNALAFAGSYAHLVEAEQLKAETAAAENIAVDETKPDWAKAFNRLGQGPPERKSCRTRNISTATMSSSLCHG